MSFRALVLALLCVLLPASWGAPAWAGPGRVGAPPVQAPRRAEKYGGEIIERAGIHLGRLSAGKISKPWAVAKLVGKTAAGTALVGAGMAGWVAAGVVLTEAGHPALGMGALMVPGLATANPFLPMPGSNLVILGGMFYEGFKKGRASVLRHR